MHSNLGIALFNQGKLAEAIIESRAALRLKPDDYKAHGNIGDALCNQEKLGEAIAEYREALQRKPDNAEAHHSLGLALRRCQGKENEAIAEFRTAIRLKPGYVEARISLGATLCDFIHDYNEAITEFRAAIRLKPEHAVAHRNLGNALSHRGKLEEAVAEYREAIRLKPDDSDLHYLVGTALAANGQLDEAITEFRKALCLKPDHAEAHCNLGQALRKTGNYAGSLAEYRKGHQLGSKQPGWQYPSAQWVHGAERLVELDRKLPAILAARAKPADAAESLGLAQLCYDRKLNIVSARFWTEAFQAEPKLADDTQAHNRYNAACVAVLASSGQGKDDPPLDEPGKARWRKQAIDWLKADLAAWSTVLEKGPPAARQSISETLKHWKADSDLAGLREAAGLDKLPDAEQKACLALWADVEALLKNAQDGKP